MTPHALSGLVSGSDAPPYLDGRTDTFVFPASVKVPFGIARRGAFVHHVKLAGGVLEDGKIRYGAHWVCPAGTMDAIFLAEPGDRPLCEFCTAEREPVVYRCYGSADHLLYIGSTVCYHDRIRVHDSQSPWWPEVKRTQLERFPSLPAARTAELRAIRTENPEYNRTGRARHVPAVSNRRTHDPSKLAARRGEVGLGSAALAKRAGCSTGHLSSLEAGRNGMSGPLLGRLASALDCAPKDLMPDEPNGSAV